MASLSNAYPTLLDVARRMDPDGSIPLIAEMMNTVNPILDDMQFREGNLQTGHQGTVRTGIPAAAWKILNYGTLPTKSTTKQIVDTCGIMEQFSEIDEEVYNLNGASNAFRLDEDQAHIEGMSQTLAETLFYGNTATSPEKFLGLTYRYNDTSAENGSQVILHGGAGADNTSIWCIGWGKKSIHGIYPKGSQAGLKFEDLGIETKTDADGRLMRVLRSHYIQKVGLHLKDWASVARLCNIDVSLLIAQADGVATVLINKLMDLVHAIPPRLRNQTNRVIYCNQTVETALNKCALEKVTPQLTVDKLKNGEPVTKFWGIPIRVCEEILSAEDLVS